MLVDWDEVLGLLDMSIELVSSLMVAGLDRWGQRTRSRVVQMRLVMAWSVWCW
jgi:hypothetical protein